MELLLSWQIGVYVLSPWELAFPLIHHNQDIDKKKYTVAFFRFLAKHEEFMDIRDSGLSFSLNSFIAESSHIPNTFLSPWREPKVENIPSPGSPTALKILKPLLRRPRWNRRPGCLQAPQRTNVVVFTTTHA